jgi:hypothetical protein
LVIVSSVHYRECIGPVLSDLGHEDMMRLNRVILVFLGIAAPTNIEQAE